MKPFLDKYKDEVGIAKALLEKDRFIKQLQTETADCGSELLLLEQRGRGARQATSTNNHRLPLTATDPAGTTNADASSVKGLTIEEVQRLLEEKEAKTRESANLALGES